WRSAWLDRRGRRRAGVSAAGAASVDLAGVSRTMSIVPLSSVVVDPHDGGMDASTGLRLVRREDTREQRSDRRRRLRAFRSMCAQPQQPSSDSATLLLFCPDRPGPLRARPSRWGTRLMA